MVKTLTENVPYNALVTIDGKNLGSGWCMKELKPQFNDAILQAGSDFFGGLETRSYGMGGSIPFLHELGAQYPEAQIIALGVLGPGASAHGPNECINLPYTKKVVGALAHIIANA